jgi:glycerophosphoryl diester phosphodiesterase
MNFLSFLTLLSLAVASQASSPDNNFWATSSHPIVTSELGFGGNYNITENTIEAFTKGIRRGASSIEFTSRRTLDSKIALFHNAKTEDGLVIEETNFEDLPAGTLELQDALNFVESTGIGFNIMIQNNPTEPGYDKTNEVSKIVVSRIVDAGLSDKCMLTAFDVETVGAARTHCDSLSSCEIYFGWLVMKLAPIRKMTPQDYHQTLIEYNLNALIPEGLVASKDDYAVMKYFAEQKEVEVFVWWYGLGTTSSESLSAMKDLNGFGVGGFITPRVGMALLVKEGGIA